MIDVVALAAAENFGENTANWLTDQMVWIALVVIIAVLAFTLIKRNFVGAIISALAGSIVVYFIANPNVIKTLGETIMNKIIGG